MADSMADSVQERVGTLEQEVHTLKYQMGEMRNLPHRVTDVEKEQAQINVKLESIKEELGDLCVDVKQQADKLDGLDKRLDEMNGGLKTLIGTISIIGTILAIVSIIAALS